MKKRFYFLEERVLQKKKNRTPKVKCVQNGSYFTFMSAQANAVKRTILLFSPYPRSLFILSLHMFHSVLTMFGT